MPAYFFRCGTCGTPTQLLLTPARAREEQKCACEGVLVREPRPPTSRTVEVLDNGTQSKKLERLADAERIYREHAKGKNPV